MAIFTFAYNCGHIGKINLDQSKFTMGERTEMIDEASNQDCPDCKVGIEVSSVEIGTIIHGTMRTEDLIPAFTEVLKRLDTKKKFKKLIEDCENFMDLEPEEQDELLQERLWDAMDSFSPKGCYFGCTKGDVSDYGYWVNFNEDEYDFDC
jgi:hypothetical protein